MAPVNVTSDTIIGDAGSGSFTQSGDNSLHTTTNLILGNQSTAAAPMIERRSLAVGFEYIGNAGTGSFTQSGGTHTVSDTLTIASGMPGSSGTYDLQGGYLSATNIYLNYGGVLNLGGGLNYSNFYLSAASCRLPAELWQF